jgi:hypothetical protein
VGHTLGSATGPLFDAITPAVVAAQHTIWSILDPERAARLVEQKALDPSALGLRDALDGLTSSVGLEPDLTPSPNVTALADPYEAEIQRAVQRVFVDRLMDVAARARMPQVRALLSNHLGRLGLQITNADIDTAAHRQLLAADIKQFLERPAPVATPLGAPAIPPGAPIGEPAMD